MISRLSWLDPNKNPEFPPIESALKTPNGLLAIGGKLDTHWLLSAYQQGIFPWFTRDQPILWWSPDPRMLLYLKDFRYRRNLGKKLRQSLFEVTMNRNFEAVIKACARPNLGSPWIHDTMIKNYLHLHRQGYAHSVEVWQDQKLVGGLYGVALAPVFFGESMFSWVSDAAKVGLACLTTYLHQQQFLLIDCQQPSAHLANLGGSLHSREQFSKALPKTPIALNFTQCRFDLKKVDLYLKANINLID